MRLLAILLPVLVLAACAESEPAPTGPAPLPAHPVGEVSQGNLPPVQGCDSTRTSGCKSTN
jgi:hypothetical protein